VANAATRLIVLDDIFLPNRWPGRRRVLTHRGSRDNTWAAILEEHVTQQQCAMSAKEGWNKR
jgi:hypothetical protein